MNPKVKGLIEDITYLSLPDFLRFKPEGNCPFEYRIVTLRPSKMEPIQL